MSVDSSGLLPDVYSRTSLFRLLTYILFILFEDGYDLFDVDQPGQLHIRVETVSVVFSDALILGFEELRRHYSSLPLIDLDEAVQMAAEPALMSQR